MRIIAYDDLADYLRQGREIEFTYKGKQYSITNHSGFWYLCDDTDHVLLDTICRFDEKEDLVLKIATAMIDGMTIERIFVEQLYDIEKCFVL